MFKYERYNHKVQLSDKNWNNCLATSDEIKNYLCLHRKGTYSDSLVTDSTGKHCMCTKCNVEFSPLSPDFSMEDIKKSINDVKSIIETIKLMNVPVDVINHRYNNDDEESIKINKKNYITPEVRAQLAITEAYLDKLPDIVMKSVAAMKESDPILFDPRFNHDDMGARVIFEQLQEILESMNFNNKEDQ